MSELDLVFLCDTTGSMDSYLQAVKDNIEQIAMKIVSSEKCDARFALVEYRDHPPQDDTFAFREHGFTASVAEMKRAVDGMEADGGGDGPESVACALACAANLPYRRTATKVVIWIADAPPHGLNARGDGFPDGCPCGVDWMRTLRKCVARGIVIYSVAAECLCFPFLRSLMRATSEMTGGQFAPLKNADGLADLILAGIAEELDLGRIVQQINAELARDPAFVAAPPAIKKARIMNRVKAEHAAVRKTHIESIFTGELPPVPAVFVEAKSLGELRGALEHMDDIKVEFKGESGSYTALSPAGAGGERPDTAPEAGDARREQAIESVLQELDAAQQARIINHLLNEHVTFTEDHVVEWFHEHGIAVGDFETAFRDGILALELVERLSPGSVNWAQVTRPRGGRPLSVFQRLANCSVLCDIARRLNPRYTGCGAEDFANGNVKMMTGFFFSLRTWERRQAARRS